MIDYDTVCWEQLDDDTTCTLERGHPGPHEPTPKADIEIHIVVKP